MSDKWAWLAGAWSLLLLTGGAWLHGYRYGIKDTERRWSDAVKRAGHK